ncbi:hypothetical protein B0813_001413 [Candidatus Fervidibacteria bacterium JGI MDM2 SSWTFF-3-K9]
MLLNNCTANSQVVCVVSATLNIGPGSVLKLPMPLASASGLKTVAWRGTLTFRTLSLVLAMAVAVGQRESFCCKLLRVMCGEGLEFGGEFADDRRDCDGWVESDEFEVRISCQPVGN